MKFRGPLMTLGAVAVFGGGMWLANVSQQPEPTSPAKPAAQAVATTPVAPPGDQELHRDDRDG